MQRGLAGAHFQHVLRRLVDRPQRVGVRRGVRDDADHRPILAEEDHVERDERVVHPERMLVGDFEEEEHSPVAGQIGPEHQTSRLLRFRARDLDLHHPGAPAGVESHGRIGHALLLLGRGASAAGEGEEREGDERQDRGGCGDAAHGGESTWGDT